MSTRIKLQDMMLLDKDQFEFTPDLPKLRYLGQGVPVFLWDVCQFTDSLGMILGGMEEGKDYRVTYPRAYTSRSYIPWYNIDHTSATFPSYMLEEPADCDFLQLPDYSIAKPLPVQGRVLSLSLRAIRELDFHYDNTGTFERTKIKVKPYTSSSFEYECYAYLNDTDSLSEFDLKDNEYKLQEGIDLTPFSDTGDIFYYGKD